MDAKVKEDFKKAKEEWDLRDDFVVNNSVQEAINAIMDALAKTWHIEEE